MLFLNLLSYISNITSHMTSPDNTPGGVAEISNTEIVLIILIIYIIISIIIFIPRTIRISMMDKEIEELKDNIKELNKKINNQDK